MESTRPLVASVCPPRDHEEMVRVLGLLLEPLEEYGDLGRCGDGFTLDLHPPCPDASYWIGLIDRDTHPGVHYQGKALRSDQGRTDPERAVIDAFRESGLSVADAVKLLKGRGKRKRTRRRGIETAFEFEGIKADQGAPFDANVDVVVTDDRAWNRMPESQRTGWSCKLTGDGRVIAARLRLGSSDSEPRDWELPYDGGIDPGDYQALRHLRNVILDALDRNAIVQRIDMTDGGNGWTTLHVQVKDWLDNCALRVQIDPRGKPYDA